MRTNKEFWSISILMALLWNTPIWARVSVSGSIGIVSEDRYRGVSLTDKQLAPQASLTIEQRGFYLSTFLTPDKAYGGSEVDISGGYSRKFGEVTADIGVLGYLFPQGGSLNLGSLDYFEVYGSLAKTYGPVTTKLGLNYAPPQTNVKNGSLKPPVRDNFYVYANMSGHIPASPFNLNLTVGRETGAFAYVARGSKIDWNFGLSMVFYGLTGSVSYVGNTAPAYFSKTSKNLTSHTAVISVTKYF